MIRKIIIVFLVLFFLIPFFEFKERRAGEEIKGQIIEHINLVRRENGLPLVFLTEGMNEAAEKAVNGEPFEEKNLLVINASTKEELLENIDYLNPYYERAGIAVGENTSIVFKASCPEPDKELLKRAEEKREKIRKLEKEAEELFSNYMIQVQCIEEKENF